MAITAAEKLARKVARVNKIDYDTALERVGTCLKAIEDIAACGEEPLIIYEDNKRYGIIVIRVGVGKLEIIPVNIV